jgi:hydrogenase maturation protease
LDGEQPRLWIIGYGNPQRRDDGSGCHVAGRLGRFFGRKAGVAVRVMHQLDPVLAEDLRDAETVLFVDATVEHLTEGREWLRIRPEVNNRHCVTHHCEPAFLLGLLQTLHGRCPEGWLVSVEGDDFGLGEGLSAEGKHGARKITREIAAHLARKMIDKGETPVKSYTTQEKGDPRWP